jgi:DNA-binding CsgD family transcriptional regulator
MSYLEFNKRNSQILLVILLFLLGFVSYDTYVDHQSDAPKLHIFVEITLLFLVSGLFIFSLKKYIEKNEKQEQKYSQLLSEHDSLKNKLSEFKNDIHDYLHLNFKEWQLTNSEKDIALLLFKGCTGKEISGIRNTNYQTVRSQISSIYRKAKVKTIINSWPL